MMVLAMFEPAPEEPEAALVQPLSWTQAQVQKLPRAT